MLDNLLSVLYKHIMQVENKNVGLKVGGGGGTNILLPHTPPPNQKSGGTCPLTHTPLPPLPTPVYMYNSIHNVS